MGTQATGLVMREGMVVEVHTEHEGKTESLKADYVFSTTSIKDLAKALGSVMPTDVASIANALEFRDFITIGVLVKKDYIEKSVGSLDDTWIYVHDPTVLVGRIQVFNSWSPYMVADQDYYWLGLEYFCDEGDSLWNRTDAELGALAAKELEILGFIKNKTIKDTMVLREKKTYPVYAGAYAEFPKVQEYLDSIQNLFPVGRNGMHRYNNQDHSMLTAIAAVDLIRRGSVDKSGLWSINTDQDYHEEKHATSAVSYRRQNY
jgi:protoporphyrinogen oxidase